MDAMLVVAERNLGEPSNFNIEAAISENVRDAPYVHGARRSLSSDIRVEKASIVREK
jgi:hypothetical protein